MKRVIAFFLLVSAVSLTSCDEAPVYEKVYSFEDKNWDQQQKLNFKVDIKDIDQEYDFIITLRTTTDYNYNNLWIFLNTITPSGQKAREPFEIKVTNPDGSWAGIKTGTVVEFPLKFKSRKLPEEGVYTFVIEQGITATEITEVLDLGFRVDKVSKEK
ncbi:MAG: gliding motility lipoprotein GldH [Bacteroidetes bacterium]|nr:MAG: gliding motility lipoprotein GldH [Bacteroidota bacterium]